MFKYDKPGLEEAIKRAQEFLRTYGELDVEWGDLEGIEIVAVRRDTGTFKPGQYLGRLDSTDWGNPYDTFESLDEAIEAVKETMERLNEEGFRHEPSKPLLVSSGGSFKHDHEVQEAVWFQEDL